MIDVDRLLSDVEKPSRYIGNEHNIVIKTWSDIKLKVALAFPDLYEIGMSHLGFQIIYYLLNRREDVLCERVFVPGIDLERKLRDERIPLFTLETKRPINEFDWIAFSLAYELTYSGIITILDLANVPIFSKERAESHPLIVAGGPTVLNPEPIADFFDIIFIGEAEEALDEIVDIYIKWKEETKRSKEELFKALSKVEGVYIPSLYEVEYKNGKFFNLTPKYDWTPKVIKRRIVYDLDNTFFPTKPLVPLQQVVHDRGFVEIMRGCQRNCRFCFAGYIYRPKRYRSVEKIINYVREIIKNTGYEEISLLSLSSSDYPEIERLVNLLTEEFSKELVSFSLPSLRADNFSLSLAEKISKVRKSGLTFAIESGSERLRKVINKGLREEDFLKTLEIAFQKGWNNIKLYFMLGLPTETNDDIYQTIDLVYKILKLNKKVKLHLSFSVFIPKPHTPFQWERFEDKGIIEARKQVLFKHLNKKKNIVIDIHDYNMSFLEAVFSRGDRRLAKVIFDSWSKGSRLEGWKEYLNLTLWKEAFSENNIDPTTYTREIDINEKLPWDHIFVVSKNYLIKEREKAHKGLESGACEWKVLCDFCGVKHGE